MYDKNDVFLWAVVMGVGSVIGDAIVLMQSYTWTYSGSTAKQVVVQVVVAVEVVW